VALVNGPAKPPVRVFGKGTDLKMMNIEQDLMREEKRPDWKALFDPKRMKQQRQDTPLEFLDFTGLRAEVLAMRINALLAKNGDITSK